jgi:hypothetical protein
MGHAQQALTITKRKTRLELSQLKKTHRHDVFFAKVEGSGGNRSQRPSAWQLRDFAFQQ